MTSRPDIMSPQNTATSLGDTSCNGFRKLFASVADPQTQRHHARHLALTKDILYENEAGWKVVELPLVGDLLQLLCNKVLGGAPQFIEQLVLAVTNCCKPFLRQKSNEEITNANVFFSFLPVLGELLSVKNIDVQVAAAEALKSFATGTCLARPISNLKSNNTKTELDDLRLTPRTFSQNMLFETCTFDLIIAVMHDLFFDGDFSEKGFEFEPTEELEMEKVRMSTDADVGSKQGEALPSDLKLDTEYHTDMRNIDTGNVENGVDIKNIASEDSDECSIDGGDTESTIYVTQPAVHPESGLAHKSKSLSQLKASRKWKSGHNFINDELHASPRAVRPESAPSTMHRESNDDGSTRAETRNQEDYISENCGKTGERRPSSAQEQQCTQSVVEGEFVQVIEDVLPLQLRLSELPVPLISLLVELSAHQRCTEVLVVSGALHYIVSLLDNITNVHDELLPLCLDILWNVLELSQEKRSRITTVGSRKELYELFRLKDAVFFLGNEVTFLALLHVIELLLVHGYRQQDKAMRNECLIILYLCAKRRRTLDFFYSTDLTACLFSYAASAEISHAKAPSKSNSSHDDSAAAGLAITGSKQSYATNSDEDLEFKQMLWFILAEISYDHEANLNELVQMRFIEIWLSYATDSHRQDSTVSSQACAYAYSVQQLQLLQRTAQTVLNHVATFIVDHFYEIKGHAKLLAFLRLNRGTDDVLASAWLLLLQMSLPLPFFQSELGQLGAIESAMEIFEAPVSGQTFIIRRNAILACACMCRDNNGSNCERFRQANGVYTLVRFLEFHPSYSVLEENILVGVLDAVRSCVIGNVESETEFINDDGVPKLLSVVQVAPKALKHQALAALAEICVNPAAIPSFEMWRCEQPGEMKNACANEMLLRLYAEEDAAEKRANQGIIMNSIVDATVPTSACHHVTQLVTDCKRPPLLATGESSSSGPLQFSSKRPESPAFARLKEALKAAQGLTHRGRSAHSLNGSKSHSVGHDLNLKSKIHAVLANVSFSSQCNSLSIQDQVSLEALKEYPSLKIGETWHIVERALYAEGVRPIYADALYIRKMIEQAYDISLCTKLTQQEILAQSHRQNTDRENTFYEQFLRQKHKLKNSIKPTAGKTSQ